MNKLFNKFKSSFDLIKIILKLEPVYLIYIVPKIIISAILPVLYVYFPKLIIEQLIMKNPFYDVLKIIVIFVFILLVLNIVNTILNNKSKRHLDNFPKKMKLDIGKIIMELEMKEIESSSFIEVITRAGNSKDIIDNISIFQQIVSTVITVAVLLIIIINYNWLFVLMIIITISIKIFFEYSYYRINKKTRILAAKNEKEYEYTYVSLRSEGGGKELRLNNLQKWFTEKIINYRKIMVYYNIKYFKRYAVYEAITTSFVAIQSFIVLWLLSIGYMDGIINIAEFIMYFSAVTTITISLSKITEYVDEYSRKILNLEDYVLLKSIRDKTKFDKINYNVDLKSVINNNISNIEIEFKDVSFTYPNTEKEILSNISIKIKDKEKLVIVGFNGAGKTTFIKLLCKFYRPTSGVITINGIDIWKIDNDEYYKLIAAVFQDFSNFAFSLSENIVLSEKEDKAKMNEIINYLDMNEMIEKLPKGFNTYLTKQFDSEGIELSGGERQKAVLARAVYKNTPLLILDEPTASLDPKAENKIYTSFFKIAEEKTTIFISHRLAASTIADNIAVFSDGRIAEYGTHTALMKQNGIYKEMFYNQSKAYLE